MAKPSHRGLELEDYVVERASKADKYLEASVRENTSKSYAAALTHYEVTWGGFLPTTTESVVRYIAEYADQLALSTLKQRLAALANWHQSNGFPDPTKAPKVRQLLKGIRALHPVQQKQAAPLPLVQLEKAVAHLEDEISQARASGNMAALLKSTRDIALLTIGFWRGFRGDELSRLTVENTHAERYEGIRFYLGSSKGDRQNIGREYKTPSLSKLCPVEAYLNWIEAAGITRGAVFRGIDRWGNISEQPIAAHSLIPLLRGTLERCGLPSQIYSAHSIRRGFATWAASSGWDIKTLMEYVGWSDMKSALRYVEPAQQFGGLIRKLEG
ncbi:MULTISPECIES: tyrosine-type recombinase/integrase [Pseudomonas]|uniref:Recombinase n=1 Tax=Pseudomonas putida TaxID=303 RepID=A0A2S3X4Q0_PSEPU|nr:MULTISPECIES: tyrosine-type recombinase/integrase [Pseudomonas]ELF6204253.1 tyrosine-type recombinase/integrase [Pseudomonas putida]MBF8803191.1 tyrosine-type recombinase/integrase [Pseudomonas asiatica]MCE0881296.1 tyrosine-type recombinase/integrase [Pseudomonas putida]MCE0969294.1 tyrosine-type recombinase/integrase [Pseudomonas sp. NMI4491_12]MDO1494517.1 tyrosine-type recombinase/integrase [Pseudomonas putida]